MEPGLPHNSTGVLCSLCGSERQSWIGKWPYLQALHNRCVLQIQGLDQSRIPDRIQVAPPHECLQLVVIATPVIHVPSMQRLMHIGQQRHSTIYPNRRDPTPVE
jgi:hypothetical protein